MRLNDTPSKTKIHLTTDDIQCLCRFFAIGKFQTYKKRKRTPVPHTNPLIFITTTDGDYALKFYSLDLAQTVPVEYAINRVLCAQNFPTPLMHTGSNAVPFITCHGRLATCFSYIDAVEAWQAHQERNIFPRINKTLFSLKNTLAKASGRLPIPKQEKFLTMIKSLANAYQTPDPEGHHGIINAALQDACKSYQQHQRFFTRQWIHNNATLTNFLINTKTVFTLDLSHIQEDYALNDLASLIISALAFKMPLKTIKEIRKDYFIQHRMAEENALPLHTLIKVQLIRKHLDNIQRQQSVEFLNHSRRIVGMLARRQGAIIDLIQQMNNNPALFT